MLIKAGVDMIRAGSSAHRELVGIKHKPAIDITEKAKALCEKFVKKVETGKARSRITYADCKELLRLIYREGEKSADKSGG